MTTVCTKRFFTKTFGIIRLRSYTCRIFIFLKLRISHKRCSKRHFNIFEEIKSLYIAQKQSHHLNDRKKSWCNRANNIIKFVSNYIIKSATQVYIFDTMALAPVPNKTHESISDMFTLVSEHSVNKFTFIRACSKPDPGRGSQNYSVNIVKVT